MAAVNALYDGGERYGALERLMETFAIGEYDPVMATFPFEKRKTLHKIYRDVSALKSLADSRDWGAIEKILEGFETLAPRLPLEGDPRESPAPPSESAKCTSWRQSGGGISEKSTT